MNHMSQSTSHLLGAIINAHIHSGVNFIPTIIMEYGSKTYSLRKGLSLH